MNAVERLDKFLRLSGISPARAERECGLSNGLIGRAINKGATMRVDTLEKILYQYPRLSAEWLFRGVGSMYVTSQHRDSRMNDIEERLRAMSDNKEQREGAYDVVLSAIELFEKVKKWSHTSSHT